jgi:hypothetical protein
MEAIPLCLLLSKLHLRSPTQHSFVFIQIVPSHVYYMFRPVLRPSSGISIYKFYKGRCNKIYGAPYLQSLLL